MSRIGSQPIELPEGVQVTVADNNNVTVKGPKGELSQSVDPDISVSIEDKEVLVKRPSEQKRHKALHGLYRSLIANMVTGVTEGYKKELELVGVGYRATVKGQQLDMILGYSHHIIFTIPPEITVSVEAKKGKKPIINLECIDKQLIGQVAAKIRSMRKPEPYKGKGIRYVGEYIRRKAGKAAAKAE